jgi:bifunctional non-homologous end joining protein LigD
MALEVYRKKRDFKRTPEPRGKQAPRRASGLRFIVQKHAATHLHYDFRLELDGVLLSWAVPKGPSLDPTQRRLAVHVEDHPLDYANFEGTIPKGEYGGGSVLLWDRGEWFPKMDPREGIRKGHLVFDLAGEKLRGGWALLRMGGSKEPEGKNWLLVKEKDDEARTGRGADITERAPESVASGKRIEEIGSKSGKVWHSNRTTGTKASSRTTTSRSGTKRTAPKSPRRRGPRVPPKPPRRPPPVRDPGRKPPVREPPAEDPPRAPVQEPPEEGKEHPRASRANVSPASL